MDNKELVLFKHAILEKTIEAYIEIPYDGSVTELAYLYMENNALPKYAFAELEEAMMKFIKSEMNKLLNGCALNFISQCSNENVEELVKDWESLIKQERSEYSKRSCASDEELFATVYHKMVHSPALETMLTLEHSYASEVRKRCEDKKRQISELSEGQTEEMNKAVSRLENGITEVEINRLAANHFEVQTFLQVQLTSELDTIKEVQRREYREWLMEMLEENQANSSLPTPSSPAPVMIGLTTAYCSSNDVSQPILEESFTIHLGSQLKQMHNIRILSANIFELCRIGEKCTEPSPQVLQTALNLYSNDLHGIVLMTDNMVGSRQTSDFREICSNSTEFHFPHIDDQLDKINSLNHQFQATENSSSNKKNAQLKTGDFYITKHSNLSQVHVIFHIVADDSLRGNDINSRHAVVLGLRNILKTACANDVTSLTIPLLLNYEMSEEMTFSWCEKRSELVFKCVKGFMIEMASWGGSELKNLQFMLPEGISSDVFQSITEMLPRIFKVSNPLILK